MSWTTETKGNATTKENIEKAEEIDFGKEQEMWNVQYAKTACFYAWFGMER
jgi:hypothetical protein